MRVAIKIFQLIKKEERRVFPKYSYFKLKEKHPENIPKFNSDEKIEAGRASTTGTIFNRGLEFAKHPHEI